MNDEIDQFLEELRRQQLSTYTIENYASDPPIYLTPDTHAFCGAGVRGRRRVQAAGGDAGARRGAPSAGRAGRRRRLLRRAGAPPRRDPRSAQGGRVSAATRAGGFA